MADMNKKSPSMGLVQIIFLFFCSYRAFSLSPDNLLLMDHLFIEDILSKKVLDERFKKYQSAFPKKVLLKILKDPKNRVEKTFKISPYFRKQVIFWAQIYTQFTTNQVLIHDKNNLSIVYDAFDYSSLARSKISNYQKVRKQNIMNLKAIRKIKKSLLVLGKTKRPQSKHVRELQKHLIKIRVKVPKGMSRKKFFTSLARNIRVQTGQRDKIFQGMLNVFPYENFINKLFDHFNLPPELLAIAFVESSFNFKATSRLGAKGVWQIMPFINKKLFPQVKGIDPLRNVLLSTLGAFHLLAQNFQILKRWDLAITAYNSGTKHIIRAKRKFRKKNLDLIYLLKNYRSRHLGFASKNFYSSFLALVYILKYRELLFPLDGLNYSAITKNPKLKYSNINVYLSKCGLIPRRLYSSFKKSSPHLSQINNHLQFPKKLYPRGTILLSDVHLASRRYYKISFRELRRNFPKNYRKLIRKKKCNEI